MTADGRSGIIKYHGNIPIIVANKFFWNLKIPIFEVIHVFLKKKKIFLFIFPQA